MHTPGLKRRDLPLTVTSIHSFVPCPTFPRIQLIICMNYQRSYCGINNNVQPYNPYRKNLHAIR